MKKIALAFLLITSSLTRAQYIAPSGISELVSHQTVAYKRADRLTSSDEVQKLFLQVHPVLSQPDYSLMEIAVRQSLTGIHYTYDVLKNGIPVFDTELRVHTNLSGDVVLVQDNVVAVDATLTSDHLGKQSKTWVETYSGWQLADVITDDKGNCKLLLDNWEVHSQEAKHYYHLPDSLVNAQVFLINPLNTAEKSYGSPYIDSNDLDVPVINAERKWVKMKTYYENDTFWLKSDRYYFGQVSDPVVPQTYSTNDTFSFTRSQRAFEDVNAFYHITQMSDYVEGLGFETALPDTLEIDAHGYNGADFSSFNYGVRPLQLEFGEGGVDDAEDGEIVVHEFSHALSHVAGPNSFSSTRDRAAMEEGNADYFSASYSKSFTDFAWQLMFNWDGHNPFFSGVHIGDKLIYPTDMTNNTNHDRELWSTPLMCLYDKIGRGPVDSLVLEHLYFQAKGAKLPDMANVLLKVDSMLWNARYHHDIRNCFAKHDILASSGQSIEFQRLFSALNTTGFSLGSENAIITSKDGKQFNYLVHNNLGQTIEQGNDVTKIILDPNDFLSGIYFVELKLGNASTYLKVLKK
ncbi:MAG: T9SS type A sorting domain-containing protein [Bacteroidia bacterium]|nr:T9SS type A sorting domain-containing protein [Bacteroidia bacterium]